MSHLTKKDCAILTAIQLTFGFAGALLIFFKIGLWGGAGIILLVWSNNLMLKIQARKEIERP